jgi:RyR domain-containing protein
MSSQIRSSSSLPLSSLASAAKDYRPAPIDTSKAQLPREVESLTEKLSRNTHEVWARQRMADGWRWGAERDDRRKLHPSLVPYEKLPESEKVYDRATATQTLKAILSLGFGITKI